MMLLGQGKFELFWNLNDKLSILLQLGTIPDIYFFLFNNTIFYDELFIILLGQLPAGCALKETKQTLLKTINNTLCKSVSEVAVKYCAGSCTPNVYFDDSTGKIKGNILRKSMINIYIVTLNKESTVGNVVKFE